MKTADGTSIELLENPAAFTTLQQQLSDSSYLAMDTEFMRTNTFYPLLGLIQLADKQACYLIDPLPFADKAALSQFLAGPEHTFVLHSCSEDLNLFYTALGVTPSKVFDTQIAAAFLGMGYSLSYQALVHDLLGIEIPKDETRSDWLKRPLSETQKIYAATDVLHLLELRDLLEDRLRSKGVYTWFEQECQDLLNVARQAELSTNWQFSYTNINNAWRLNDTGLHYLRRLCLWREQEARRRDKPRSWIAKDSDLLQIASAMSRQGIPSLQGLQAETGIDNQLLARYGSDLIKLISASASDAETIDRAMLNNPLTATSRNKLKACQRVVEQIASEHTIAPELLGRKKIILELVRNYEQEGVIEWPAAVSDWRRGLLEPALIPILTS